MRVSWSAEARTRLEEIHAYIARESPVNARRVMARLLLRSKRLGMRPSTGRRLPEYPNDDLREVLEQPFRIIYSVRSDVIRIITIKHYRQNLPRHPRHLTQR